MIRMIASTRADRPTLSPVLLAALFLFPTAALAAGSGTEGEGIIRILLSLVVILLAAKLGGDLAVRISQPAVLGELFAGVVLGNLVLLGPGWLEPVKHDPVLAVLAEIGVILLLFEVGLESTVPQMIRVGLPSFLVGAAGVVAPFFLGWGVGRLILPAESVYVHIFLGATLTATSVGITARVLRDLGRSRSPEARLILGAAVIDDVLGLVILSAVIGVIEAAGRGESASATHILMVVVKAVAFLGISLSLGLFLSPRLFGLASRLRVQGVLLPVALSFCFGLAAISGLVGLAPIVGAYAAGLILEDVHYRKLSGSKEHALEELVAPISAFLVPVFFVLMGMRVDLSSFARLDVLGLAALLTVAAIAGKQICSLVVGGGLDRIAIGLGMIPRGEVGLIFANIGLGLTLNGEAMVSPSTYSAIVVMVMVTTMATPPLLQWRFRGSHRPEAAEGTSL